MLVQNYVKSKQFVAVVLRNYNMYLGSIIDAGIIHKEQDQIRDSPDVFSYPVSMS